MPELKHINNSGQLSKPELCLELPLISVITISLNSLEFIEQTIEILLISPSLSRDYAANHTTDPQ
jgi:hypothetical protein